MITDKRIRARVALMRELHITEVITPELTLKLEHVPFLVPKVTPETAEKLRQRKKDFDDALLFASAEGMPE